MVMVLKRSEMVRVVFAVLLYLDVARSRSRRGSPKVGGKGGWRGRGGVSGGRASLRRGMSLMERPAFSWYRVWISRDGEQPASFACCWESGREKAGKKMRRVNG